MHSQAEPAIMKRGRADRVAPTAPSPDSPASEAQAEADIVLDDLLVEDVSIDGMCGVY